MREESRLRMLKESMISDVKAIDMKDVDLDEVSIRIGGRMFKLKKVEAADMDIEKEIRKEYSKKLSEKLSNLGKAITDKMDEAMSLTNQIRAEAERKEAKLKKKLEDTNIMPDVTFDHAKKGLSVSKGYRGEVYWYVRRVYWPKYVDRRPIKSSYVKKMITPIIIMVTTKGNKITGVSTRQIGTLEYFSHYHQSSPDCWGQWHWINKWESPYDIIKTADDAISVLENINSNSLANRSPRGLPRWRTLQRNLEEVRETSVETPRDNLTRSGIDRDRETANGDDSIWTA